MTTTESMYLSWVPCAEGAINPNTTTGLISESLRTYSLSLGILCSIMSAFSTFINTGFLYVLIKDRSLQTIQNKLLMLLSASDLLQGCITLPLLSAHYFKSYADPNQRYCFLITATLLSSFSVAFMTLLTIFVIVFIQYLAIVHPFIYRSHVRPKRLIWLVIMFSFISLIGMLFCALQLNDLLYVVERLCGPPVLVLLVTMLGLFVHMPVAIHGIRKKARGKEKRKEVRNRNIHLKLFKTASLVLVSFVVCYLPPIVFIISYTRRERHLHMYVGGACSISAHLSGILDCFVYQWRDANIRRATMKLFQISAGGNVVGVTVPAGRIVGESAGCDRGKGVGDTRTAGENVVGDTRLAGGNVVGDTGCDSGKVVGDTRTDGESLVGDTGCDRGKVVGDTGTAVEKVVGDAGTACGNVVVDTGCDRGKVVGDTRNGGENVVGDTRLAGGTRNRSVIGAMK